MRIGEERLTKLVWKAEVSGPNLREDPEGDGWKEWRGHLVCEVCQWSKEERVQ